MKKNMYMILPILLGSIAVIWSKWWLLAVAVMGIFICVGINPICNGLEMIWIFVLSFFTLLPGTCRAVLWMTGGEIWNFQVYGGLKEGVYLFLTIVCYGMVMMCVELVLMLALGRIIWPIRKKRG